MDRYIVVTGFHVFVPPRDAAGALVMTGDEQAPDRKLVFNEGQVVKGSDVPENQTIESWLAKGLVRAAAGEMPTPVTPE